jgi:transposase-like protein
VREISPRFLSQDERIEIADLRHAGLSIRQIANRLGRAPSTVSRELRRNATQTEGYRPFDAHRRAIALRARDHRRHCSSLTIIRNISSRPARHRLMAAAVVALHRVAGEVPEELVVCGVLEVNRDQLGVHTIGHRSTRQLAAIQPSVRSAVIRARPAS